MWTEIVTGGVVVGLVITILKFQHSRIAKKVDIGTCEKEHGHIEDRFRRGEDKFDKFNKSINEMNVVLARVDERVKALAKKNGV